jgi:hypothetical protein
MCSEDAADDAAGKAKSAGKDAKGNVKSAADDVKVCLLHNCPVTAATFLVCSIWQGVHSSELYSSPALWEAVCMVSFMKFLAAVATFSSPEHSLAVQGGAQDAADKVKRNVWECAAPWVGAKSFGRVDSSSACSHTVVQMMSALALDAVRYYAERIPRRQLELCNMAWLTL